tara:strand:+ start:218 stop:940 length:723 start_codon:yes stop_codon:yes gene_type:complete
MALWTSTDNQAGKPKYDNGADVFGVDTTEISAGSDNVVSIAVDNAGTGYASAPDVAVGGNTSSVATVSGGKVTALSVAGTNNNHTSVPTVTIDPPAAKTFNGETAVGSNAITFTAHGFATGDALTYAHSGGTVVGGLTTATTYYAIRLTADTLSLATTADNANSGTVITLTDGAGANHTLTGATATATASLGSGNYTHAGWVKRTEGTGGRAGRVQYETLVAMSTISGDDNSADTEFPDA